jgi:hypothetical protein
MFKFGKYALFIAYEHKCHFGVCYFAFMPDWIFVLNTHLLKNVVSQSCEFT